MFAILVKTIFFVHRIFRSSFIARNLISLFLIFAGEIRVFLHFTREFYSLRVYLKSVSIDTQYNTNQKQW